MSFCLNRNIPIPIVRLLLEEISKQKGTCSIIRQKAKHKEKKRYRFGSPVLGLGTGRTAFYLLLLDFLTHSKIEKL